MMRHSGLMFLLVICFCAGCSTSPSGPNRADQSPQASLNKVVYEDGISSRESEIIVTAYLQQHLGTSYGYNGPYDGGANWVYKITEGAVPVESPNIPPVLIDKSNGTITWNAKSPVKR